MSSVVIAVLGATHRRVRRGVEVFDTVALDWRPRVAKPIVRRFTPVLRPLFESNHDWAMRRGQERILELFASREPA